MVRKTTPKKESYWREVLNRQADSGLSIRAFCVSAGISQPSFYAWRKKLREGKSNGGERPRKLSRRTDEANNDRAFIPLQLRDSARALEVIHPFGCRVRVTGEVDVDALRQVLEVLDRRGDQ